MHSRRFVVSASFLSRQLSSLPQTKLVSVTVENGIATVAMNRAPVNSLNLELFTDLSTSIKAINADKSIKGFILTSASPNIFSAGLDLTEMHNPEEKRLRAFWSAFQETFLDIYTSRLPSVASIHGAAPAAGCMLAMACNARVVLDDKKCRMGLNEAAFGLIAPFWLADMMTRLTGYRVAERAIALGTLFTPTEAKAVGLVDVLVPVPAADASSSTPIPAHVSAVKEEALKQLQLFMQIPSSSRNGSLAMMRRDAVQKLKSYREGDVDDFVKAVMDPGVQRALTAYLEALKKPKQA